MRQPQTGLISAALFYQESPASFCCAQPMSLLMATKWLLKPQAAFSFSQQYPETVKGLFFPLLLLPINEENLCQKPQHTFFVRIS